MAAFLAGLESAVALEAIRERLRDVFEDAAYVKENLLAAEQYATRNSGPAIAGRYLDLFNELLDPSVPTGR